MRTVILSIGDELALGQTVDTNSAWLAARLAALGIPCLYHETIADDIAFITQAIQLASHQADLILITGGLGPTQDDMTRQALAAAMGVELIEDADARRALEARYASRNWSISSHLRVQAMCPAGCATIPNTAGSAPGLRGHLDRADIYVMPGVPREMKTMFEKAIEPQLTAAHALACDSDTLAQASSARHGVILTTTVHTFGLGESAVADKLGELMARDRNPKVGTTVANGFVSIRVRSEFPTRQEADDHLNDTLRQVNERMGVAVFGRDLDTLQEAAVRLLERRGKRLVTAESCTGGLLGQMVTDVPGCSTAYMGGWITYSNLLKIEQLDVPQSVIAEHGAVSEATVRAMAQNALRAADGADISLAVSGVAGPGGGGEDKPVGTVWLGMAMRDERDPARIDTRAMLLNLPGQRDAIRDRAAKCALQMLRLHLMNQPLDLMQWGVEAHAAR